MGGGNLVAILYKANETDFSNLGLGVLNEAISILITEERNGIFELEMKYPTTANRFKDLKLDRLIKADANHKLKDQRFKIIRISKPMDGVVTVFAEHISYLSQDLALKPSVIYAGNANVALTTWKNNMVDAHPFTVYSDIATAGSGKWSIKDLENARQALGGISGSILDSYGGEYEFDNYDIRLYANRGRQSDMLIAYGRNLTELTQEETIDSTFTSIYPYTVTTENETDTILTLPEYFVDSQYVGNFARRKIMKVDFSQDGVTTVEQLRAKANSYIVANGIGIPKVNLKVKYIDLAKSLDYKDTQSIEEVNLCDWVTVYFENFDIQTNAKIIKVVWDEILNQYDSIEIGEARANLTNAVNTAIDGKLETITQNLITVERAANGKNKVYRGVEEPFNGVLNDLWYKPVGSGEVEMYIHNGIVWHLEKYSGDAIDGTVNFANVNAINLNLNRLTTATITGANMLIDLQTGGQTFVNPANGSTLLIQQDKFYFDTITARHYLIPDNEGIAVVPGTGNTGNDRNAGIRLQSTNFNFYDLGIGSDGGFLHRIGSYPDTMAFINKDGGGFTFSHTGVLDILNPNTRRWDMTIGLFGQFKYGKTTLELNGYDTETLPKLNVRSTATGDLGTIDAQFLNIKGSTGEIGFEQTGGDLRIKHGVNRNWLLAQGNYGSITYGLTRMALNGHETNDAARLSVYNATNGQYGYVSAAAFNVQSERESKDDIQKYTGGLSLLASMKFYEYEKYGIREIGLITDESPLQVLAEKETKVSLYSLTSVVGKSTQELSEIVYQLIETVEKQNDRIAQLEENK